MSPQSTKPTFREAALGERYYEYNFPFTGIVTGFAVVHDNTIENLPPPKNKYFKIDEEVERFWSAYEGTVQKFEDNLQAAERKNLSEGDKDLINTIRGMIRSKASDADITNRDIDKIPGLFRDALAKIKTGEKTAAEAIYSEIFPKYQRLLTTPSMELMADEFRDILLTFLNQYDSDAYPDALSSLQESDIIIAESMSLGDVSRLEGTNGKMRVKGGLLAKASETNHAVINAKAHAFLLGWSSDGELPKGIQNGARIILDADHGMVIVGASDKTWEFYQELEQKYKQGYEFLKNKWKNNRNVTSRDERSFKNYINGDTITSAKGVNEYGANGIGLIRLEGYIASLAEYERDITEEQFYEYISNMVEESGRSTLVFRLMDVSGDKAMEGFTPEKVAEIDKRFIAAFIRYQKDNSRKKLNLMIPNTESGEQLAQKQAIVDFHVEQLGAKPYTLGSMAENHEFLGALEDSEIMASFLSTGTNDMSASTTGTNRHDGSTNIDLTDPDVLTNIQRPLLYKRRIEQDNPNTELPISVCGDMASQPENLALLIGMGYDRFSLAAGTMPIIKELQSRIEAGNIYWELEKNNPEAYNAALKKAQNDDNPSNAWALLQRVLVEKKEDKRRDIITRYNKKYLGLDAHNKIDLNWTHPNDVAPENKVTLEGDH